jgi:hypothetical protein
MDSTTDPAAAYVAYVKSLDKSRFQPVDNFLSSPELSSPTEIRSQATPAVASM